MSHIPHGIVTTWVRSVNLLVSKEIRINSNVIKFYESRLQLAQCTEVGHIVSAIVKVDTFLLVRAL